MIILTVWGTAENTITIERIEETTYTHATDRSDFHLRFATKIKRIETASEIISRMILKTGGKLNKAAPTEVKPREINNTCSQWCDVAIMANKMETIDFNSAFLRPGFLPFGVDPNPSFFIFLFPL
ncbi:hypothetical protein [Sporolactobacillus vineae]|uniref:hypothetical protein n=1 Tax=Sporolactobacillus vineae TaxID=444463 RepID=UPI000287FAB4|nr:hypothetical protein [Sporolactobacillus vineae]